MNLLFEIKNAWGWTGINPTKIIGENSFGNLIIEDNESKYWRLCPEDGYCEIIANNKEELQNLFTDSEFLLDWDMQKLVATAISKYGRLKNNKKFALTIPGFMGGEYKLDNINTVPFEELIRFSGDLAFKTKDLPDGSQVKIKIVD